MDKDGSRPPPAKTQEDDSFLENLRTEWKLFWHGIIGEDDTEESSRDNRDPFKPEYLEKMSVDQIKQITRALSMDRKKLNQKIEEVQKNIDSLSEDIESQKLVGADTSPSVEQIKKLMDVGQLLSQELEKLNKQITKLRSQERKLTDATD
jgi:hypothetical protein